MSAPLADRIRALAVQQPSAPAFLIGETRLSWAEYDARSDALAHSLLACGFEHGERIAVLLPDGPDVHVAFLANEKAGLISMGIGPRAGESELEHLMRASGATGLISAELHQERSTDDVFARLRAKGLPLRRHLRIDRPKEPDSPAVVLEGRGLAADEIFLLNSTSGTTGMPKIVVHDQARWFAFHEFAVRTGRLGGRDVFMSVVPAPFGFGIWTSHVTPAVLGVPTVLLPRFSAADVLEQIERHRVTVLAAVSTQFIMMLECEESESRDLSSLQILYTGGEAVPYERAAEFEERTGASVLQFYGSNETGAVSGTSVDDSREKRLRTAGRPIPEMNVRLFDETGREVSDSGRGQPGCKGPTLSRGYWADDEANRELIRSDGWMLLGDIVEIDAEGYLSVVGRSDDFIIRGGKNISGSAVELQVANHPAVSIAAAVAMPDRVFGEKVCVFAELRPGRELTLEQLLSHLAAHGVSKENFPERLEIVEELPRGSGGKIAKQELSERIAKRVEEENAQTPDGILR
ncbi:MAG: acyl--CoA ligase [bacterium]|nr:acyl--CoA ligase [bacterium]